MPLSEKEIFDGFIKCNQDQRLYVMSAGKGYITCLGFDVAFNEAEAIAKHYGTINLLPNASCIGTPQGYAQYRMAIEYARAQHDRTGLKCPVSLTKQLIGLEGRRVEVVDVYGAFRRFKVGKSTGFIPCHIELANERSSGGVSADKEYKSVKVIR